jgi:hypothetical protein
VKNKQPFRDLGEMPPGLEVSATEVAVARIRETEETKRRAFAEREETRRKIIGDGFGYWMVRGIACITLLGAAWLGSCTYSDTHAPPGCRDQTLGGAQHVCPSPDHALTILPSGVSLCKCPRQVAPVEGVKP